MTGAGVEPPVATGFSKSSGSTSAFVAFIQAAAAVALLRAGKEEPVAQAWTRRLVGLARDYDGATSAALDKLSPEEQVFRQILDEEMWFFVWVYRSAYPAARREVPQALQERYADSERSPHDSSAVDDFETIATSVDKLIDKLPGPLKKIVHAMLEVLKLFRGLA